MLAVELPAEMEARLDALAAKTGRSKADYAREAILQLLEAAEDAEIATERLRNPAKRWTLEELEQGLDLDRRMG